MNKVKPPLKGRPRGRGTSRLDGKEKEIQGFREKGVNRANIARIYGVSWPAMNHFIKTRGL